MRTFVAIELARRQRDALAALQRGLSAAAGFAPVRPERFHLTLKFLGEIDAAQCATIESELERIRAAPIELRFSGLGAFPSRARPRVVWVGVRAATERGEPSPSAELGAPVALTALAEFVDRATRSIAPDKPFAPHVTIARSKSPTARLPSAFFEQTVSDEPFRVSEFVLYRSTLSTTGAEHEVLRRFRLVPGEPGGSGAPESPERPA